MSRGNLTTIDVPGAKLTVPFGINARGEIAGVYSDTSAAQTHCRQEAMHSSELRWSRSTSQPRLLRQSQEYVMGYGVGRGRTISEIVILGSSRFAAFAQLCQPS
jgi:hypothetical protein